MKNVHPWLSKMHPVKILITARMCTSTFSDVTAQFSLRCSKALIRYFFFNQNVMAFVFIDVKENLVIILKSSSLFSIKTYVVGTH